MNNQSLAAASNWVVVGLFVNPPFARMAEKTFLNDLVTFYMSVKNQDD